MSARLDKEPRVVDIYLSFLLMRPCIPAVFHAFSFFVMFPVSIRINYVDMHEVIILRGLLYMAAVIIYKLKGYSSHFEKSLFSHSFPHSSSRSSFPPFSCNQ